MSVCLRVCVYVSVSEIVSVSVSLCIAGNDDNDVRTSTIYDPDMLALDQQQQVHNMSTLNLLCSVALSLIVLFFGATIARLPKVLNFFCERTLLKSSSFAKGIMAN